MELELKMPQKLTELEEALRTLELENKKLKDFISSQGMNEDYKRFDEIYQSQLFDKSYLSVGEKKDLHTTNEPIQIEEKTKSSEIQRKGCSICR